MKIEALSEGPITSIGNLIAQSARVRSSMGNWHNANGLYLAFKKWAKTKPNQTDPKMIQQFLNESGFPQPVIEAAIQSWNTNHKMSGPDLKSASRKLQAKNAIGDTEIQQFFTALYAEVSARLKPKQQDASNLTDEFDSDRNDIIELTKKYGVTDPKRMVELVKNVDSPTNLDPKLQKALAILGFVLLKY